MADPISVNGNDFTWGSIIVKVAGERLNGFDSIAFGDKRERVVGYGLGRHQAPTRRSRGKYSTEPTKLRGFKSAVQHLRKRLASLASGGRSYGDVEFEIVVQYIDTGNEPHQVVLSRNVIVGNTTADEEGTDLLKEEIEISTMSIERDGLVLFDASSGRP